MLLITLAFDFALLAFPLACLVACRQYGGAIYLYLGTLLADAGIRFVNNTDSQGGGAIYNYAGSVILYGPYFYGNTPHDIRGSVACYSVCEAGFYGNSNGNANISSDTDNPYLYSCPSYDSCEMCPAGTYMTEISSKYSSSIDVPSHHPTERVGSLLSGSSAAEQTNDNITRVEETEREDGTYLPGSPSFMEYRTGQRSGQRRANATVAHRATSAILQE